MSYKMMLLEDVFAVCGLESDAPIPLWATESDSFFSITKTVNELSIVCSQDRVPEGVKCENDFRCVKILGPLDFSLIGILSSVSNILANANISIFVISTFDTDYVLIKQKDIGKAIKALNKNGFDVDY